ARACAAVTVEVAGRAAGWARCGVGRRVRGARRALALDLDRKLHIMSQPQVERFFQQMSEMSDAAKSVLWGNSKDGAVLREKMTSAMGSIAARMPNAVVY